MIEFARGAGDGMPRIFGVNHHPEIVDRPRQLAILRRRQAAGEVTTLVRGAAPHADGGPRRRAGEQRLALTSTSRCSARCASTCSGGCAGGRGARPPVAAARTHHAPRDAASGAVLSLDELGAAL